MPVNHKLVYLVDTLGGYKIPQHMMTSDETDTHRTIQQLCEKIHQLEAVSQILSLRDMLHTV